MAGGPVKTVLPMLALTLFAVNAAAQGSITGTVYDSLTTRGPLANATVVLVERSRYATTDARGRFRIDSVPDGRYTLGLTHPVLDALDLVLPLVPAEVSGGRRANVVLATPSMLTAYARICPDAHDPDTGVIIGSVRDADDHSAAAGADVGTEWTDITLAAGRVNKRRAGTAVRVNSAGVYLLCGAPTGVPLDVFAEHDGFIVGPVSLMLDDRLIRRIDFTVSRRDSAARDVSLLDSTQAASTMSGTASLRGMVLSSDDRPVRSVIVDVRRTHRSARTDSSGHFRIDGVPAGTRSVEIRAIGFAPAAHVVQFAAGATVDTSLSIGVTAQDLAAVTVKTPEVAPTLMGMEGFEKRRAHGLGRFYTKEEIDTHSRSTLADVLTGTIGIHVEYTKGGFPLPYLRGTKAGKCIPNFFLDGAPFYVDGPGPGGAHPFTDLSSTATPDRIRGMEVYTTAGTMPAEFDLTSSTSCGSVLIWTR